MRRHARLLTSHYNRLLETSKQDLIQNIELKQWELESIKSQINRHNTELAILNSWDINVKLMQQALEAIDKHLNKNK